MPDSTATTTHSPRPKRLILRWVLLTSLLGMLAAGLTLAATAAPAKAATVDSCIHPTFKFCPGSAIGRVRYGEVDFHFDACSTTDPVNWNHFVSLNITNATEDDFGFFLPGSSIYTTSSGYGYADFEGKIPWKVCTPRVGWPCSRSGAFHVRFHGYIDYETGRFNVFVSSIDLGPQVGLTLFTTP